MSVYKNNDEIKFKLGDFVRLKRPLVSDCREEYDTSQIFVVSGLLNKDENGNPTKNYHLDTVTKYGEYKWAIDFDNPFQGVHESELEYVSYNTMIRDDNIDDINTPLWFLQRLMRGEIANEEEIIRKLENGEISLCSEMSTSSWRMLAEHKNWQPQAKFYAIDVKTDTDIYADVGDDVFAQNDKRGELAVIADELFEKQGKQAFIAISRFKNDSIDLFAICKPNVKTPSQLNKLTLNACKAFRIETDNITFLKIKGEDLYKRLRHSASEDLTEHWIDTLEDFGIAPYHFEGDYATTPWIIGEDPY